MRQYTKIQHIIQYGISNYMQFDGRGLRVVWRTMLCYALLLNIANLAPHDTWYQCIICCKCQSFFMGLKVVRIDDKMKMKRYMFYYKRRMGQ